MAEYKQYITQVQENGNVMISEDVIATIVANTLTEVDGVVKGGAEVVGKKSTQRSSHFAAAHHKRSGYGNQKLNTERKETTAKHTDRPAPGNITGICFFPQDFSIQPQKCSARKNLSNLAHTNPFSRRISFFLRRHTPQLSAISAAAGAFFFLNFL